MRYRRLDANGDMTFGNGSLNFLIDSPEAVAQAVMTRLELLTGEWFLDVTEGTPYGTLILGNNSEATADQALRARILGTQGVTGIPAGGFSSSLVGRKLSVAVTIDTLYGQASPVEATLP